MNLEDRHVRDRDAIYTRDRVLDLDIEPDRTVSRKDEDELLLAVEQGRFDAEMAATIEANADSVRVAHRRMG